MLLALLVVASLGIEDAAKVVSLDLEVAYPVFAVSGRIWAVKLVPRAAVVGLSPGDSGVAEVTCNSGRCDVTRVSPDVREGAEHAATISCRLMGHVATNSSQAIVLLKPFPLLVSDEDRAAAQDDSTSTVHLEVKYVDAGNGRLTYAGHSIGRRVPTPPVRWK
jgi:hypothetical protein